MFQIRKYQARKRIPISTITVSDHFLIIKVVWEKKLTYPYEWVNKNICQFMGKKNEWKSSQRNCELQENDIDSAFN